MNTGSDRVDHGHRANAAILNCLDRLGSAPEALRSAPRGSADEWELGAHPDLVAVLWDEIDAELPKRCAWILHGRATLVRPKTGLVFGLVWGTRPIVLRVPVERHAELALEERARVRLAWPEAADCEPDWVFVTFDRARELARVAFDSATG